MTKSKKVQKNVKVNKNVLSSIGSIKMNVNAAFSLATGEVAIGVCTCDHSGKLVAALSHMVGHCQNAEEAEAKAIKAGFRFGIDQNLNL
jgi:hypothetical protein